MRPGGGSAMAAEPGVVLPYEQKAEREKEEDGDYGDDNVVVVVDRIGTETSGLRRRPTLQPAAEPLALC
ncbi:hypothetical protein VTN00DRAFT_1220 [Thermoascus crustaceus]|uniref:uncharacterized protein n=1 Tax=Thermoascus crustaceus TaxID=5088 RepID=UPI003742DB10